MERGPIGPSRTLKTLKPATYPMWLLTCLVYGLFDQETLSVLCVCSPGNEGGGIPRCAKPTRARRIIPWPL